MKPTEIKANDARQLLEHPLLQEVFSGVRENMVQSIEACPLTDDDMRNQLMLSLQVLQSVKEELMNYIQDSQIETE